MKAREKKLDRMNTMPTILPTLQEQTDKKGKKLERIKTVPFIAVDSATITSVNS